MPDAICTEVAAGGGLYLREAARLFPPRRQQRPVTIGCLVRWIRQGVRVPGGTWVRLEAVRLAGKWITSQPAIERFLAAQTPALADRPAAPQSSSGSRQAAVRAGQKLRELGIH